MQRTLIILKPDCVQRRLIGRILRRFEDKGLTIVGIKLMQIPRALAERQYAVHRGKPFYPRLLDYVTSGPVVVLVLQGVRSIEIARTMMGRTFGYEAAPGTIRGDFAVSETFNLVHGSDSVEAAETEIALYFEPRELLDYRTAGADWTYRSDEA